MILPRTRLLARLTASEPRLVRLCAPPGYGKSSLAQLLARRFDHHAECDCTGVTGVADLAARALAALAEEAQLGGESIALARLRLHAAQADAAAWSRTLLETWKVRSDHALFIFVHAENIARDEEMLSLLGDLLAARPAERVVAISTREQLPMRFTHYVPPHQILTLTRDELRFDDEEARSVFESTDLPDETVERILRLAAGRPLVLQLLALFAQYDSGIASRMDALEQIEGDRLHKFLANEVLSGFTPDMMATMLATAAIPNATLEDLSAATGIRHGTAIMDRLLRLPGFITSNGGAYRTHPLLLDALYARDADALTACLMRAARDYEASGDLLRAAELYVAHGDAEAAATALDRLPATYLHHPSTRLIDALVAIPMPVLSTRPNLWIATLPHRRRVVDTAQLYDEAVLLLKSIPANTAGALHRRLRVRLAMFAQELERLREARALLETDGNRRTPDESPEEQRLMLMTAAIVAAKQGRFAEADEYVDESDAVQGARHMRFDAERTQIALEKARFLGDWTGVLKMTEEMLYAAQSAGATSRIVEAARAVAQAAWYCDADAQVATANRLIEDCDGTPFGAAWHRAFETTDVEEAKALFDRAIASADEGENDFVRITIRVVAALTLASQRRRLLEGRVIAQRIESPPLQASLELLIDSPEPRDFGIFKPLAERVARSPLKVRADVLSIDILRGQVRRGGEVLHVSDRSFELLAALALLPAGTSKEGLAATIWPGLDAESSLNALKMCVSRARVQVGEREAILSTKSGYALSERVTIDVRELERLLRSIRGARSLSEGAQRQAAVAVAALASRERRQTAGWTWFTPYALNLEAMQRDFASTLMQAEGRNGALLTTIAERAV